MLIELWEKSYTKNDMGNAVAMWTKKYTVHALIKPMKASTFTQADQLTDTIETQFVLRYNSAIRAINIADMIIYDPLTAEWYDITAPIQTGYNRRSLIIMGKLREHPPQVM